MSKKANKVKREALAAEKAALELAQAAAAAVAAAKAAELARPPGKKATLIAAKKAGNKVSSRRPVTRERTGARSGPGAAAGNTPSAWTGPAAQTATRAFAGRMLTAQIAPKFKPTIGARDANALALGVK
jgi:hypothetical protein